MTQRDNNFVTFLGYPRDSFDFFFVLIVNASLCPFSRQIPYAVLRIFTTRAIDVSALNSVDFRAFMVFLPKNDAHVVGSERYLPEFINCDSTSEVVDGVEGHYIYRLVIVQHCCIR